jgi:hypothetical protein
MPLARAGRPLQDEKRSLLEGDRHVEIRLPLLPSPDRRIPFRRTRCRLSRRAARRRPTNSGLILSPLAAAGIAAACLAHDYRGPFDPAKSTLNLAFWIACGMAIGLVFRFAMKKS